ncbi:vigilin-like [Tropilaelaps mercedesae]|uniref:Vigilin-like n=1 Tax=Tropilaelaps mercedesae TaxID=418985 RepID=A0A1V9Y3Z9_9ACAR|nr:vigilin-like [Tropilaelaps mercedesae]
MDSIATTSTVSDTHTPNIGLTSQPERFTNGPSTNGTDLPNNNNNGLPEDGGKCYDELFPALPGSCLGGGPAPAANGGGQRAAAYGSWGMTALPAAKSLPALLAINKTEFFTIPSEERRYKDVPSKFGGAVDCDQVSEREKKLVLSIGKDTDTSIELTTSKMDGGLTIVISGRANRVSDAKKAIIAYLVREAQVDLVIPKDHHRHILGVKAQKLRALEAETSTKVTVPRPEENSEIVSIKGPKEGIAQAVHRIQTLSDMLAKSDREEMEVEKKYHVFIYGPNNKTLESIRQQTGAKIHVPPLSLKDQIITISGEKEGVAEAKKLIAKLYEECKANIKDTSMQVPKEQHKYILGRGNQTLQDMFEKTGVWIEVPPQESDSQTITLFGEPNKLGKALSLVYEKANSMKKVDILALPWLHKHLIGKKGENINRIRENFKDANVEFVDQTIKIEGPSNSVEQVRRQLQQEIDSITARLTLVEVRAPPSYHSHIIGKNGAHVNRLKSEFDVKIQIPAATEEANDVITIEGEPQNVAKAKRELEDLIDKLRNEHTRELKCESRLHGQIIGQGGDKISEIRKKFNQVNISFPDAAKNIDMITIRGDRRDVDECYAHLAAIVKELQRTQYKLDVPLFRQFVRFLQSAKGRSILGSVQQETGAKIQLPKDSGASVGGGSEQVSVIAERDKAEKARALLLEQQRKNSDVVEKVVLIPSKFHGPLLRYKRALLNSILEEAGCNVSDVDVDFPANGSNSDRCIISGPKDMVAKAKSRLEGADERQLGVYSEELKARPEHHRFLIGRQGANIRKLREKTSARIIVPAEDSQDRETIIIVGREQAVRAAREELEAMITELENVTQEKVTIPAKYHKHFIARRAEVLSHIQEEFGVQVSFPKIGSGSEEVTLKGSKDCVAEAIQRLLEITKELDSQITVNCVIPQAHHRSVMGPKGVNVQGITKQFGVQIKFPEKQQVPMPISVEDNSEDPTEGDATAAEAEAARNVILITGTPDKCEAAKAALEALVPITEEVPVDAKLHRFIIGQKGKDVRELMDKYEVNIKVPQSTEGLDIVRVTGLADNVARCRLELEDRIKKLMEEEENRKLRSFSLTVEVPARHHSKIVGRKGAVVMKLRNDYNVQIQLPAKGERGAAEGVQDDEAGGSSNVITVTGYEHNAYAARDEILRMVQALEETITRVIKLDHRIHSRIIGQRGRNVKRVMDEYKVEIKFPRQESGDPDLVEVIGQDYNVEEAIQYLKNQEDDLMDYVTEETAYQRPQEQTLTNIFQSSSGGDTGGPRHGFVVTGAPWSQSQAPNQSVPDAASQSDFPSFGAKGGQNGSGVAWGPRR